MPVDGAGVSGSIPPQFGRFAGGLAFHRLALRVAARHQRQTISLQVRRAKLRGNRSGPYVISCANRPLTRGIRLASSAGSVPAKARPNFVA
jgi:hypothetical protein